MITTAARITYTVDWYSYTADFPLYHLKSTMAAVELEHGMLRYPIGIKFLDGRIELTNPQRPEMRTHIQYSGSALLSGLVNFGVHPHEIISIYAPGEKISRIDLAVDVKDGCLDIDNLAALVEAGEVVTKSRFSHQDKTLTKPGNTLYIGSPQSDLKLRIYDKAAEQGVVGEWTRLELQIRGERASQAKSELASGKPDLSGIPAYIRGFCDFPTDRDFRMVINSKSACLDVPARSETDTEAWLLSSVSRCLAKAVASDPTGELSGRFWEAYKAHLADSMANVEVMVRSSIPES